MTVQVDLDLSVLDRAFERTVQDFADACQDAFDAPIWAWPAPTRRRSGAVVESPRNIVDLGTLKGSQQAPVVQGTNGHITWDADHATAVFLGAVYRKRAGESIRRTSPARNLPRHVAQTFDWAGTFLKHF